MNISDFQGPGLVLLGTVLLFFFVLLLGLAAKIPSGIEHRKIFLFFEAIILASGIVAIYFGINLITILF